MTYAATASRHATIDPAPSKYGTAAPLEVVINIYKFLGGAIRSVDAMGLSNQYLKKSASCVHLSLSCRIQTISGEPSSFPVVYILPRMISSIAKLHTQSHDAKEWYFRRVYRKCEKERKGTKRNEKERKGTKRNEKERKGTKRNEKERSMEQIQIKSMTPSVTQASITTTPRAPLSTPAHRYGSYRCHPHDSSRQSLLSSLGFQAPASRPPSRP
uniref:Uncharacterized protein n=1 Tax=Branchiostoma floridae TaxID=7739 RepID=C3ZMD1_BRAFL|eukprot:XP_002590376.1 hypothetical protein BRAFLDRAFT_76649 [Branchiostoma floridae]